MCNNNNVISISDPKFNGKMKKKEVEPKQLFCHKCETMKNVQTSVFIDAICSPYYRDEELAYKSNRLICAYCLARGELTIVTV